LELSMNLPYSDRAINISRQFWSKKGGVYLDARDGVGGVLAWDL
jgi:hypothetical protein